MPQDTVALIGNQPDTFILFRRSLVEALKAVGCTVFALVPGLTEADRQTIRSFGAEPIDISLDRTGIKPWRDFLDLVALRRTLKQLNPDVTLAYFIKPVIYGTLAAKAASVPRRYCLIEGAGHVFADDEPLSHQRRIMRLVASWLYKAAFAAADRVFVLNQQDRELFLRMGLFSDAKCLRLPGIGVDLKRYRPTRAPTKPVTFLLAARLIEQKGIRFFVDAARLIKRRAPTTRFILLGGIDRAPEALPETTVRGWVEEGIIEWPGQVPDVRPWLEQASAFVLPTYYREGMPRSILEAMAMARPIITTDAPGCSETVIDGETGFIVPQKDVSALAKAMKKMIGAPERIVTMGEASRQLAERAFDVQVVNRIFLDVMALSKEQNSRPAPGDYRMKSASLAAKTALK